MLSHAGVRFSGYADSRFIGIAAFNGIPEVGNGENGPPQHGFLTVPPAPRDELPAAGGLWTMKTFKLSNDPKFAEKFSDVVGLYVDPPAHAVVLSIDEKSQS